MGSDPEQQQQGLVFSGMGPLALIEEGPRSAVFWVQCTNKGDAGFC